MGTRAAIQIQRGVDEHKQWLACMIYIDGERWSMLQLVPAHAPEQAVQLVRDGRVDVIVTAFDSDAAQAIAADIAGLGRVVFVHPSPTVIEPPPDTTGFPRALVALVLRWWRRGVPVREIADRLDEDTGLIRRVIRRGGSGSGRTD
jgi:hypothetical protein